MLSSMAESRSTFKVGGGATVAAATTDALPVIGAETMGEVEGGVAEDIAGDGMVGGVQGCFWGSLQKVPFLA